MSNSILSSSIPAVGSRQANVASSAGTVYAPQRFSAEPRKELAGALPAPWDYLVITASNPSQARSFRQQLDDRRQRGLFGGVREALVVEDPAGARVGSGGSTLFCLLQILNRELPQTPRALTDPSVWSEALGRLRVLIVHAGGDSRRLPVYGPCGKLFTPVPDSDGLPATLFDRQLPIYLALPSLEKGAGQIVITSGDVLLTFDPGAVRLAANGITGLGCLASPERCAQHGVYSLGPQREVDLFLQKPSVAEQAAGGAAERFGRPVLDVGVMGFDAATAMRLLQMCQVAPGNDGKLSPSGTIHEGIMSLGLDFYREIACALGGRATLSHHREAARAGGSKWDDFRLAYIFKALHGIPFHAHVLDDCEFLHFGTTRQLLQSGSELSRRVSGPSRSSDAQEYGNVRINNRVTAAGRLVGEGAWIEACHIGATLTLGGENVVVGVDVERELALPRGACLDLVPGSSRSGDPVCFVRCFGIDDTFKNDPAQMPTFCGQPIDAWLAAVGAAPEDVYADGRLAGSHDAWHARLIPAERDASRFRRWLWMFDPAGATRAEKLAWRSAERYSFAEMLSLADLNAFHRRRTRFCANRLRECLHQLFLRQSGTGHSEMSAAELAYLLLHADDRAGWVADLLTEAHRRFDVDASRDQLRSLIFPRIMHTLGSALQKIASGDDTPLSDVVPGLQTALPEAVGRWLATRNLAPDGEVTVGQWSRRAQAGAFERLGQAIVSSGGKRPAVPQNALRADEIVWGRAPARIDLCGGWTDTPPYALEFGGSVLNAAVNLNGQPPVQAFARVVEEPVICIASIDRGTRTRITRSEELLDYRELQSEFSLAKAALVLSGFSPAGSDSLQELLQSFGGGIELTTLAAIPKGSGLGTSSIMGAVVLAVLDRVLGRELQPQQLFHRVLQLEQAMTTGGGWQDQVGGAVDGVKLITTLPGMVPEPVIQFVPGDVLEPQRNGGTTLLYYTGITRLAKNILGRVVGRYLDRQPEAMATLAELAVRAPQAAAAMAQRDTAAFGRLVDAAWQLNKRLDPGSSNEAIEALLARVRSHVYGAKLLGAGGGGFLLMVCKSPEDAGILRAELEREPPNERARFFDFQINCEGLRVTVC